MLLVDENTVAYEGNIFEDIVIVLTAFMKNEKITDTKEFIKDFCNTLLQVAESDIFDKTLKEMSENLVNIESEKGE